MTDDINMVIDRYLELQAEAKQIEAAKEGLKTELKLELKKRGLTSYTGIQGAIVRLTTQTRENVDKERVRQLLGEIQFREVIKPTTFEVLTVLSSDSAEKQKSFLS